MWLQAITNSAKQGNIFYVRNYLTESSPEHVK